MSLPRRSPLPLHRPPTPPGEILRHDFLEPRGLTQTALAARMGVTVQAVKAIIHGRRAITAETAIRLSRAVGATPQFWLNLQNATDLWHAARRLAGGVLTPRS
jgi:addiction module HigA family antidote